MKTMKVRSIILLFFLFSSSTLFAENAVEVSLWGKPKSSKFIAQESPAPGSTAIINRNISLIFNSSSISLQASDDQLTGNLMFDAYFPYKQITDKKVSYAALDFRYQFIGGQHAKAKLLILVNGKVVSQTDISSSISPSLRRISRVKLGREGGVRVTILCQVQRSSYQEDALCTFDTLDIYDASNKK